MVRGKSTRKRGSPLQGALYHLCQGQSGDPCDKVNGDKKMRWGSYVASLIAPSPCCESKIPAAKYRRGLLFGHAFCGGLFYRFRRMEPALNESQRWA